MWALPDAFGAAYDLGYSCPEEVAFAGQGRDAATGWYRLRARQYDPKVGRFVSPDPSGYAGGENLDAYAANNPVRWVDLTGLDPTDPATGRPADEEAGEGAGLFRQARLPIADEVEGAPGGSISGRPKGPTGTGRYDRLNGQGIYVLQDDEDEVRYVGRGDAPARVGRHKLDAIKGLLRPKIVANNNLTRSEARGLEHLLIEHYGGPRGRLLNDYHGIKPGHPLYSEYIRAGLPLFDEALYIIGR